MSSSTRETAISFQHLVFLPRNWQKGPYCGFYALAIALTVLYKTGRIRTALPPRHRSYLPSNHSHAKPSLAEIARTKCEYKGGGWIFDLSILRRVAELASGCSATLHRFGSLKRFNKLVVSSLSKGYPIIIPYDLGKYGKAVGFYAGQKAHHGTIIGFRYQAGELFCRLVDGNAHRCWIPSNLIFRSNRQLVKHVPVQTWRLKPCPGKWSYEITHYHPWSPKKLGIRPESIQFHNILTSPGCEKLRGHMIVVTAEPIRPHIPRPIKALVTTDKEKDDFPALGKRPHRASLPFKTVWGSKPSTMLFEKEDIARPR